MSDSLKSTVWKALPLLAWRVASLGPKIFKILGEPQEGVDSISFFDDQELAAGVDVAAVRMTRTMGQRHLPDADLFDAAFFGINTRKPNSWTRNTVSCWSVHGRRWKHNGL